MADTNFTPGTVVTSEWLNDINDLKYVDLPGTGAGQGGNLIRYQGPATPTAGSVNERLSWDVYVTDPQFGAINGGAAGADSTVALRAAVAYVNAMCDIVSDSLTASARRPRLIFPPGLGFKITLASGEVGLAIRAGVEVVMHSPLWVAAAANAAVVGIDYVDARGVAFNAPRNTSPVFDVRRITQSDWSSLNDIGVRVAAVYVADPYFRYVSGFCVSVDGCFGYGDVHLGDIRDCQRLRLTNRTAPTQFTNHLRVVGGTFSCGGGVGVNLPRYGFQIGHDLVPNTLTFEGQSFELNQPVAGVADCIPYLVEGAVGVSAANQRMEATGRVFARTKGVSRNCSFGLLDAELPFSNPTSLMLDDQSTGGGANFVYRQHGPNGPAWKRFFETGRLADRVVAHSGSTCSVVNMETATNVGAAPAVQTFAAVGGLTAAFDAAGNMTTGSVLIGVRVRLNGARSIGITGRKSSASGVSLQVICFDAAGLHVNTPGAVSWDQSASIPNTGVYGGTHPVTLQPNSAPQNAATHFEGVLNFSSAVAVAFISVTSATSGWSLLSTDDRPEWFSATSQLRDEFVGNAIPVALANVTYAPGMRVRRAAPAVGQPHEWVLDSGGTWRSTGNL